jgi:hypothetical protein
VVVRQRRFCFKDNPRFADALRYPVPVVDQKLQEKEVKVDEPAAAQRKDIDTVMQDAGEPSAIFRQEPVAEKPSL